MSNEKRALRFSMPPYTVAMMLGEVPILSFPGTCWKGLERCYAPLAESCRQLLLGLRTKLNWSRTTLAAFLGTSEATVRRWETGERHPSGAARRLVWLLEILILRPVVLHNGLDLLFWGRSNEVLQFMDILDRRHREAGEDTAAMP